MKGEKYRINALALRSICLPTPSSPLQRAWCTRSCASSAPSGCGRPASPGWCWCSFCHRQFKIFHLNVIDSTENRHTWLPVWLAGKSHLVSVCYWFPRVKVAALKTLWLSHTRELIEAGDFLSPVESEKTHFVENSAAWRKRRIFAERVRGFCGKRKTQYSARAPEQKMGTIETFPGAIGRHISPSTPEISQDEFTNILHTSTKHLCATYISKATRNQPILVLSNILEYIVLTLTCSHSPFILAIAFSSENSLLAELEISCNLSPSLWTPASRIKSIKTGTREWLWCNLKILKWWLMTWWAQIFMIWNLPSLTYHATQSHVRSMLDLKTKLLPKKTY